MTSLHIACAASGAYIPHSAAMLHSALANGDDRHITVHYLHGPDMSASDSSRIAEMVERGGGSSVFHAIADDRVAGLATGDGFPSVIWYRIFLPELIPDVDRVIYLDVDTIVLDSLVPLWEVPLGEHCLAGVTNVFQEDHADRSARLGLPGPGSYFNTGVMVMNLAAMRRERSTAALAAWAREHSETIGWPDQDTFNVVLGSRRMALHPRWNCMNSIMLFPWSAEVFGAEAVADARRNPAIRHFEGPGVNKPWHYLCDREGRDIYRAHRRATPWPRFRPEGRTPRNVVRRALAPARARSQRPASGVSA